MADGSSTGRPEPLQLFSELTAEVGRVLDVLAGLSHQTNFSIGCYCDEESRCHRSILRELLEERGAAIE